MLSRQQQLQRLMDWALDQPQDSKDIIHDGMHAFVGIVDDVLKPHGNRAAAQNATMALLNVINCPLSTDYDAELLGPPLTTSKIVADTQTSAGYTPPQLPSRNPSRGQQKTQVDKITPDVQNARAHALDCLEGREPLETLSSRPFTDWIRDQGIILHSTPPEHVYDQQRAKPIIAPRTLHRDKDVGNLRQAAGLLVLVIKSAKLLSVVHEIPCGYNTIDEPSPPNLDIADFTSPASTAYTGLATVTEPPRWDWTKVRKADAAKARKEAKRQRGLVRRLIRKVRGIFE